MSKISREKKFDFRDIFPLIVGIIVFATLVFALVFVINYDVKELKENKDDPEANVVQEEEIDDTKLTCGKGLKEAAEKIGISYEFKEFYIETAELEDSDEENTLFEDIYEESAVVFFDNFDKEKFELKVKDDAGQDIDVIDADEDKPNTVAFVSSYARRIITYKVEIISKECGDVVRKMDVNPPVFNIYSRTISCFNYPEFKYCSKYTYETLPNWQEFKDELAKYADNVEQGRIKTSTTHDANQENADLIYTTKYTNKPDKKTTTKSEDTNKEEKEGNDNAIDIILISCAGVIVIGAVVFIVLKKRSGKNA